MQDCLRDPRRLLCWLFYVEGATSDLWAWSGMHTIEWDGQEYLGVGHVLGMDTVRKDTAIQQTVQEFTLNGLDPAVLGGLELSVRGKIARVWLAGLDATGQVIPDPILISELLQDTLTFTRSADDVLTLGLNCFEALPFVGKASNGKYSHERQLRLFPGDVGFKYTSEIGLAGATPEWRTEPPP